MSIDVRTLTPDERIRLMELDYEATGIKPTKEAYEIAKFPSIAEQQAYWERKEKEQDDLAADTRMDRLSSQDYDDN